MDDSKISPEIPKRETSLPKYTIDELLEQGFIYFSPPMSNYMRAINKWMQACSQAYSENDLLKEAKALSNIGCAYRLLGNLRNALEHQWSSFRLTQKLVEDWKKDAKPSGVVINKKKKTPSNFWVNIIQDVIHDVHSFPSYSDNSQGSNISRKSSSLNYAKFKKYKSIKSGITTPNTVSTPSTAVWVMDLLSNLGNTYFSLGNFEEAVKYYNASLGIADRILKKYPIPIESQNSSLHDLSQSQQQQSAISQISTYSSSSSYTTDGTFNSTINNAYLQQQQQQLQLQQQQNQFLIKSNTFSSSSETKLNSSQNKNWLRMIKNKPVSESSSQLSTNQPPTENNEFMEHSLSDIELKKKNKYTYIHRSCAIAKSRALTHLGLCYDSIFEIKKAEYYHKNALSISKYLLKYASDMEVKNKRENSINLRLNSHTVSSPVNIQYASIIANIGNNYFLKSNLNKALNYFYLALNIFDWEDDKMSSKKLSINIGSTWITSGKLYLQGSWWHDNETKNTSNNNEKSIIPPDGYIKINTVDEAKMYIKKGINLLNEQVNGLEKHDWISKVYFIFNFANANTLLNNYKEAFRYFGKLTNIKSVLNQAKIFPDIVMPIALYNLSQAIFVELLSIKKDKLKPRIKTPEEIKIKELLGINKEGFDVFPTFLELAIENISIKLDKALINDQKNSQINRSNSKASNSNNNTVKSVNSIGNKSSTVKSVGSTKSNNNTVKSVNSVTSKNNTIKSINSAMSETSLNRSNSDKDIEDDFDNLEDIDPENRAKIAQINNIGFDLNLNLEKSTFIFYKYKFKTFQLISTTHLARIAWLIYSGAIKPINYNESKTVWYNEANYWIRQLMVLLSGAEDIVYNIRDKNNPMIINKDDGFNKSNINWEWKIKYFDEGFLDKVLTEHCKNFLDLHGEIIKNPQFCNIFNPAPKEPSVEDKANHEANKKRVIEKKFGLRIKTYEDLESLVNKNDSVNEKILNSSKDDDEIAEYIINSMLYLKLSNGRKIYVNIPVNYYIPSVVACGNLYLSILFLLDSISKTEAYNDIKPSNKLVRLLLKYSHSIYSLICFTICPNCIAQFWSMKPKIDIKLTPEDEAEFALLLKNKKSIMEKVIEESKNNPSSVVSPLAYYLNDFNKDGDSKNKATDNDENKSADENEEIGHSNSKIKKSNTTNTYSLAKAKLMKSQPPQKTSRYSSLLAHKEPGKSVKYNSCIVDKKDNMDDPMIKKILSLEKEGFDPKSKIHIDSSSIKAFNNINSDQSQISQGETSDNDENNKNINNKKNKDISLLIEKQIDDHISSITNSENGDDTLSNLPVIDDKSEIGSQIDEHEESISSSIAEESFEEIMKERLDIYVDDNEPLTASTIATTSTGTSTNSGNNLMYLNSTSVNENEEENENIKIVVNDIENENSETMVKYSDDENKPMENNNEDYEIQSPYVSTSNLEKSFLIISQSLDLSDDFDKESSICTDKIITNSILESISENDDNNKENNDKILDNINNEIDIDINMSKEEYIKELIDKKMWDVWEKYLSGDPVTNDRELIRFPCVHNQI